MGHEFDIHSVDAAIEFVISEGAEDRGGTVSYSRVFEHASLPAPQDLHQGGESHLVTQFMKAFHDRCIERALPPLDSLVVHVAGPRQNLPGLGYFRVNDVPDAGNATIAASDVARGALLWQEQKSACTAWGTENRRRRRRGNSG